MPETAQERFARILQLVAQAGGEGMAVDALAEKLGVTRRRLERDIEELTTREYYLPGGAVPDIQVFLEGDHLRIRTTGPFQRPTRLSPGEAAALDLGLRILAAEREDDGLRENMAHLLEKLAWAVPADLLDRFSADDPATRDGVRALLVDAARRRVPVRFQYLKPDADGPEDRCVEPYAVVYGEGRWYVVGRSPERDGVRVFRLDRMLDAALDDGTFPAPEVFNVADHVTDGRVYRAEEEITVTVRYTPEVAPWLLEQGLGRQEEDGAVVVRHSVADPAWIVREVLRYGAAARVVEPAWVREQVAEAAERLASGAGSASEVTAGGTG